MRVRGQLFNYATQLQCLIALLTSTKRKENETNKNKKRRMVLHRKNNQPNGRKYRDKDNYNKDWTNTRIQKQTQKLTNKKEAK